MLAGEERNLRPRRGQRPEQLARLVAEERGLQSSSILTLLLSESCYCGFLSGYNMMGTVTAASFLQKLVTTAAAFSDYYTIYSIL